MGPGCVTEVEKLPTLKHRGKAIACANPRGSRVFPSLVVSVKPMRLRLRAGMAMLTTLTASLALGVIVASPAQAYPSWDDVLAAKGNAEAKAAQVASIQTFMVEVQAEADAAQAEAQRKGDLFAAAREKFDEADQRTKDLTAQADAAKATADAATTAAGRLAAQLYRSGGTDMSISLLLDGGGTKTDDLLSKLGNMSKLVERSTQVYDSAQASLKEADALNSQAEVAKAEREQLKIAADAAFQEASTAAQAAAQKLAETQDTLMTLSAQLAALEDESARTAADYEAGVEEAKRIAAARAAAEAAARGVDISDAGWTRPSGGYVSDWFGPRQSVWTGYGWSSSFHRGIDLAARCGNEIYASSGGQVVYAGWNGGFGNYIEINHGGGIRTGYAHQSRFAVGWGDWVGPGQVIGYVGTTGTSTGCHLHFEVRQWGSQIDPAPFMADRGVWF
jgi:murein DD-endopeptidase MepM/ murein hydrolase activator NlpD